MNEKLRASILETRQRMLSNGRWPGVGRGAPKPTSVSDEDWYRWYTEEQKQRIAQNRERIADMAAQQDDHDRMYDDMYSTANGDIETDQFGRYDDDPSPYDGNYSEE